MYVYNIMYIYNNLKLAIFCEIDLHVTIYSYMECVYCLDARTSMMPLGICIASYALMETTTPT